MATGKSFLDDLRAIVLENYTDERFGVSELVEKIGISRSQLHRKLKGATGQSVSQFIREIRLEEAAKLLRENDFTASEVAYKVGFNSATYFNTCFNEYFGYPPGEAKHHETALPEVGSASETTTKKNKRVLVWLSVITVLVGTFFIIKYLKMGDDAVSSEETEKPKTIAVLPFKNWSGDPELEYVSDGMTDAVIRRISAISDIKKVVPFKTILVYKNSDKSISEIARELKVEYVLDGNFKLAGEQIMSNLDLIEVDSNNYLWSLEYKGVWRAEDIFSMQADVAENVAENMNANITSNEKDIINDTPTLNEEAYRYFLRGDQQYYRLTHEGLLNSIDLFNKARTVDTTYADAYFNEGRAYMLTGLVWGVLPEQEAWNKAKPLIKKALFLDSLKNGHYNMGMEMGLVSGSFYFELDIAACEKMYQEKVADNPLKYWDFAFEYTRKTGRFEVGKKILELRIDQYSTVGDNIMQIPFIDFLMGDYEATLE